MLSAIVVLLLQRSAPVDISIKVDGVERTALLYPASASRNPVPTVFMFHGFTGNARQASFSARIQDEWPEANVVYPQGLEVSLLSRKGPGWQIAPRTQGDRDVRFYDALLAKLKSDYHSDSKLIYSCGMSNGAIFTYVLLSSRSQTLAAAAPVSGFAPLAFRGAPPKPILITHGRNDPLIDFKQAIRSRDWAIANNGAGTTEQEMRPGFIRYTPVKDGNDVVWHPHDGGHVWPQGATKAIVTFFKNHPGRL